MPNEAKTKGAHVDPKLLGDVVLLMANSDFHGRWFIDDLERLIIPPLELDQFYTFEVEGRVVGFVSWAFLLPEAVQGYVDGTRKIQPEDWNAGGERWVIDLIAPFGNAGEVIKDFRRRSDEAGLPRAKSKNTQTGRVRL